MLRRGRRRADDRGSFLVIGSVMMVTLLAFAALAIDVANARQHRRQLQNAADSAALAAAQDLPDLAAAVATAKSYADRNYDIAAGDWNGCQDSDHLAQIPDTASTNQCISFPADATRVRVKLPGQQVDTFFGAAIGRDSLTVGADAVAGAVAGRANKILPAAVTGPMGTGLLCIEQSGNSQPCATRERGQFGSLNSPRLNFFHPDNNVIQTTEAINYAMNVDHDIGVYEAWPEVCDGNTKAPCVDTNVGTNLVANHLITTTGNDVPPVTEGYVTGFSAATTDQGSVDFCGRLERPDFTAANIVDPYPGNCNDPGEPTIDVIGHTVNGRHVYYWLDDEGRALFYPEAWALTGGGASDTDAIFALTNAVLFGPGDDRLDCFLAGYRFDTGTGVETLPDCTSVGLTLDPPPEARQVGDAFNGDYSNNSGTQAFSGPWTEIGDDGNSGTGSLAYNANDQRFTIPAGASDELALERSLDLANATAVTLSVDVTNVNSTGITGSLAIEVSTDGSTWTTLGQITPVTANGVLSYDISAYAGGQLDVRLALGVTPDAALTVDIDTVLIDYTYEPPIGQVAPIFKPEFNTDPRWGVIPRVAGFKNPTPTAVEGFWGFYSYETYTNDNKVQALDGWVFDPALMVNDARTDSFFYGFAPDPMVRLIE